MTDMTAEERAQHIEALGPATYKDKTLWFRSDKVLERLAHAEQAAYERAAKMQMPSLPNDATLDYRQGWDDAINGYRGRIRALAENLAEEE